ncbi:TolC family protein [Synechococcus sp. LA31]|uniref:TolC family protein n=1 Tax=Synechococcus sp. LA31 TaxID=2741953 RepID=UPI002028516A|nr:TolC family protein [Synechococcus sp. LA31]
MTRPFKTWLVAASSGLLAISGTGFAQQEPAASVQEPLPLAPQVKGPRPKSDASVLAPAATKLDPSLQNLAAPATLALPNKPEQVRIVELRPLSLKDVENLAEVNNPNLKAIATQVDQAQSQLRTQIAAWYPTLSINASSLPSYTGGNQRITQPTTDITGQTSRTTQYTYTDRWAMGASLTAQWDVINPQRVPQIAAARDQFEQSKNQYLIALRELRLQAAQFYFKLQLDDDTVRIGQQSVRASLVSLRDARARFQAGVATKLEVLEAETQLARDQQLLTNALADQSISRRNLARLLDLPQNVSPTAEEPLRPLGVWTPSLQESVIAAYAFREELDNALLDISAANSQANSALGSVQPFLTIFNSLDGTRFDGVESVLVDLPGRSGWAVENSVGLSARWNIFDGGAARAQYRQAKQRAQENSFRFAQTRDDLRFQVEESFYQLRQANRNIQTTSREVISSRESLRLARLRFQAGVSTQREVVDNQRDLTQAEVRYATALAEYNNNLALLRRRTGLDQVAVCQPPTGLGSSMPVLDSMENVPVPSEPLQPACQATISAKPAS